MASSEGSGPHRLGEISHFANLPTVVLDKLAKQSRVRNYRLNHTLWNEGDETTNIGVMAVLEAGMVKQSRDGGDGGQVILAVVEAPVALGELSLIDGGQRHTSIVAMTDITVRWLDRGPLRDVLNDREIGKVFADALLRTLTTIVRRQNVRQVASQGQDVAAKVASWLLIRASISGESHTLGVTITVNRTVMADELGIARGTISGKLTYFENRNVIARAGSNIVILDPQRLASLASVDTSALTAATLLSKFFSSNRGA